MKLPLPQNTALPGMTDTLGGVPGFVWIGGVSVPGNLKTSSLVPGLSPRNPRQDFGIWG